MTETLYNTFQDMSNIFRELSHQSDKCWRNEKTLSDKKVPTDTSEHYHNLKSLKNQIREEQIVQHFNDNAHKYKLDFQNLYLPPLENNQDFVPILSMECNLNDEHFKISLRVEMQGRDIDNNSIGFGFRFESPHQGGNHNYWHIQVITENDGMELKCPQWLPSQDPCIPVKVTGPIDFIFFMLSCFYGKRAYKLFDNNMYLDPKYRSFSGEYFS